MTETNAQGQVTRPLHLRWFHRPHVLNGPAVVTGVFDVLHVGHVRFLRTIAERGLPLVVGLESDDRLRAWKGPERPVHPEAERAEPIAALSSVQGHLVHEAPA